MKMPFSKIDYANIEHLEALLYVEHIKSSTVVITFDVFKSIDINSKSKQTKLEAIISELNFIAQFQDQINDEDIKVKTEVSDDISTHSFIEEVANELMLNGISADYLMNSEMDVIPGLINSLSNHKREKLENDRLWTYFSILPHIDNKQIKSAIDLMPFPWEQSEQQEAKEKEHAEALSMAEQFLNN